jgi:hypothetical protein
MTVLRLVPAVLSLLLLAAHFYRAGLLPVAIVIIISCLMLAVRREWSLKIARLLLFAGGLEWIRTTIMLTSMRQAAGAPWMRLAFILGVVIIVCYASLILLYSGPVKRMFKVEDAGA